jgi:hypothetical protein
MIQRLLQAERSTGRFFEQKLKETEEFFFDALSEMAKKCNWPWIETEASYETMT